MPATARSVKDDPFQNHRFHVFDSTGFLNLTSPAAGFSSISLPELNIDFGEYREGLWTYSRKFPLRPHFTPISLHKGVVKNDTSLFKLAKAASEGKTYRTNITIKHFHRTDVAGLTNYKNSIASRQLVCFNCMPTRHRPSADFDSTNPDVSIEELDLEFEFYRLFINGVEVTV